MSECPICNEELAVPRTFMCVVCTYRLCDTCMSRIISSGRTPACPGCRCDYNNLIKLGRQQQWRNGPIMEPRVIRSVNDLEPDFVRRRHGTPEWARRVCNKYRDSPERPCKSCPTVLPAGHYGNYCNTCHTNYVNARLSAR